MFIEYVIIENLANAQEAKELQIVADYSVFGLDIKLPVGTVFLNETFFINQDNSPVNISGVAVMHTSEQIAKYVRDGRYENRERLSKKRDSKLFKFKYGTDLASTVDGFSISSDEGLKVRIAAEGSEVAAVKFSVVAFDAFKEHLGSLTAVSMDPPSKDMEWDFKPSYLFLFKKYGVLAVFVKQVRLNDGEIWNFDEQIIFENLKKRYESITEEEFNQEDTTHI